MLAKKKRTGGTLVLHCDRGTYYQIGTPLPNIDMLRMSYHKSAHFYILQVMDIKVGITQGDPP